MHDIMRDPGVREEPRIPLGPYALLLVLHVPSGRLAYIKNTFPLHTGDVIQGARSLGIGRNTQVSIYLPRLYVSGQQIRWIIENAHILERHWFILRSLTNHMPAYKGGLEKGVSPETPVGPNGLLLKVGASREFIEEVFTKQFPLHAYDFFYDRNPIANGSLMEVSVYLSRLYLSHQQVEWLVEHGTSIQNHWIMIKEATHKMPAIKLGGTR